MKPIQWTPALLILIGTSTWASFPVASPEFPDWFKWDDGCYERSKEYTVQAPQGEIDGVCSKYETHLQQLKGKSGLFKVIPKMSYRHLPQVLAEFFHSKALEDREQAYLLLQNYECENRLSCDWYVTRFNSEMKSLGAALKKEHPKLYEEALNLQRSVETQNIRVDHSQGPVPGLCQDQKGASQWLAWNYQLVCPMAAHPSERLVPNLFDLGQFKDDLNRSSGQVALSSSLLEGIEHRPGDCQKPWEVTLTCGGSVDPREARHLFRCGWDKHHVAIQCFAAR